MTIQNIAKEKLSKVKEKEEKLSEKLVHKIEAKGLPTILNAFTEIGSTYGVLIIFLIIAVFSGLEPLLYMFPLYFAQLFIVEIIKLTTKRNRPKTLYKKERIFKLKTTSGSFPSGHSSNIFTLAVLLTTYYQTRLTITIIAFLTATLVSISRLYLGRHYILDIIGGTIIGITITILLINSPLVPIVQSIYHYVFY